MILLYKLLFDICLYLTLTGFYVGLAAGTIFTRAFYILMIPLLVWIVYAALTRRLRTNYEYFYDEYHFGLRLLIILIPGFIFGRRGAAALAGVVPFLVLMLCSGTCLLRMLRERTHSGLRQALYLAFFVALSAALTVGRFLQNTAAVISWLWLNIVSKIVLAVVIVFAYIFYLIIMALAWLFSFLKTGDAEPPAFVKQEFFPADAIQQMEVVEKEANPVLRYLLVTAAVLVLLFIIWQILKRLLGEAVLAGGRDDEGDVIEKLERGETPRRRSFLRRARPADTVRYYYAKYLRECSKRNLKRKPGDTSLDIADASRESFPEADPEKLRDLYVTARYSDAKTDKNTAASYAEAAEKAWKELKASRKV